MDNELRKNYWENFVKTGSIGDYLSYKSCSRGQADSGISAKNATNMPHAAQISTVNNMSEDRQIGEHNRSDGRSDSQGTEG